MNGMKRFTAVALLGLSAHFALSQSLDPAKILEPHPDSWPTYSGDYSGQRYSKLDLINQGNIKGLSLAWSSKVTSGSRAATGGGFGQPSGPTPIVGGVGTSEFGGNANIRGALIQVDGVIYATRSGTSTGRPKAARTSATAASACGTTASTWRRPTTT